MRGLFSGISIGDAILEVQLTHHAGQRHSSVSWRRLVPDRFPRSMLGPVTKSPKNKSPKSTT